MGKQVLIVDDCKTTRKLLSYIVRGGGYETIGASNGIEALEKLATNKVNLVLTDLNMPQMDGIELSKQIRDNESYKDIPIIMITTESGEKDREMSYKAGVTTYLVKPISPKKLLQEIEKTIK